jgi:GNAT superfamily N-acetyltransferase
MNDDSQERLDPIPVTVTFLKMDAPPKHYPPLPMHRQLALLRTRTIPLHFYRYLMDRVGRKWHWVNALRMEDAALAQALHAPDRDIRVLYMDGAPAGFFDIKMHLPRNAELGYFGLMDHAMGLGVGRWFLGAAIEACWSHGPREITVQTCTLDHPSALPLYQKLGFEPVGQTSESIRPMPLRQRADILLRPAPAGMRT